MGYVFNPFIGNFDNVGTGGGGTGGVDITHVEYCANLPAANLNSGKYYFVDKDTIWNKLNPLTKTQGGLYRSDGITWLAGVVPELAGVSDGTNVLVDYPVVFSGVTVDNTAKTVTINSQTDNNLTNALKSTYDGYATTKLDKNTAITGATKTKITYDTNGLITAGTDATTADIADSTDKRYCSEDEKTKIANALITTGDGSGLTGIQQSQIVFNELNVRLYASPWSSSAGVTKKVDIFSKTSPSSCYDVLGNFDASAQRIIIPKAGTYFLSIMANTLGANVSGQLYLKVYVNGSNTAIPVPGYFFSAQYTGVNGGWPMKLNAGDYVEIYLYSNLTDNFQIVLFMTQITN